MNDKIDEIRRALRSVLSEEIHTQAIISIEAVPSKKNAEWESVIRINGFERALSRGSAGFGGGVPTAGASHGDSPSLEKTEEDVGSWKVLGLPDRTETGMNSPTPWISFMDWFYKMLASSGMKSSPSEGFGDKSKPYNQLTPAQKRQRKYGVPYKSSEDPEFTSDAPGLKDVPKTRALAGRGSNLWQPGFHIKRYVTLAVQPSLGEDPDTVLSRFRQIITKAKPEPWFRIDENKEWDTFFVYVNVDSEMPEGWRDRAASIAIYDSERKAEWENMLRDFSEYRSNVAQLRPLLARLFVDKYKFEEPFNVTVLDPKEYDRAKKILESLKLDDLAAYAREIGAPPLIIGQGVRGGSARSRAFGKTWDDVIERLAAMGPVDELIAEVALSRWMTENGFGDPFDFDSLPAPKKLKAIVTASRLTWLDIAPMAESVQAQIKSILE